MARSNQHAPVLAERTRAVTAAPARAQQSFIIKRPRLTRLLDETSARIILLIAPAGYGKTTLAREWLESRPERVAWYAAGPEMADYAAAACGLAEAIGALHNADDCAEIIRTLASRGPRPEALGQALASTARGDGNAILVIDDYQQATESPATEALVGAFVRNTQMRLLLTSRVMPSWLLPRMTVYGEVVALGIDDLSFTDDEARTVLGQHPRRHFGRIVAQARGWPAVIGLAAMRNPSIVDFSEGMLPDELYEYLAEALFRATPLAIQRALCLLVLAGEPDPVLARELLGSGHEAVVTEAVSRGFVTREGRRSTIHPLIRVFLLRKLGELDRDEVEDLVGLAVQMLSKHRRWDGCLAALSAAPRADLITSALREALIDLLDSGRVATISRWVQLAEAADADDPILLLADAEVALRQRDDRRALSLGERAAALLQHGDLAARAHLVAARAAHLSGDDAGATSNATRAQALATSAATRVTALWIEFVHAIETETPDVDAILDRMRDASDSSPAHALRLVNATGVLQYEVRGDIRGAVRNFELAAAGLLPRVKDPLMRTTFRNLFGHATLHLGAYERTLSIASALIEDAKANGLEFAIDHALTMQTGALIGLRRFAAAQRSLRELEGRSSCASPFVQGKAILQRARLRVAAGDVARAAALLGSPPQEGLTRAFRGEWFATRAVFLAALGNHESASEAVRAAREATCHVDARVLAQLADAILLLRRAEPDSRAIADSTLREIVALGHLDGISTACRAFPQLAAVSQANTELTDVMTVVLLDSRDLDVGRAAGLRMPRELRKSEGLSPRETEVLELIVQGRTNIEIAETLFISVSTTKVHVRHIFEKLKVRSRAEAASVYFSESSR